MGRVLLAWLGVVSVAGLLSACTPAPEGGSAATASPGRSGGQPLSESPAASSGPSSLGDRVCQDRCAGRADLGDCGLSVKDIPGGCSYSTEYEHPTTVEILRPAISTQSAFEQAFAQLSGAAPTPGKCAWEDSAHSAFTCTGTAVPGMPGLQGASQSMVFTGGHAWHVVVATSDPAFVPAAEAGAWKLVQELRRRNM